MATSSLHISMANGNLIIALLLIGLASLVLGMGVPVTAAYLITAVLDLKVANGQEFAEGQEIAVIMDGDAVKKIFAPRDGVIKNLVIRKGERIESGRVLAEVKPKPIKVFSSMFSAVLGTLAFSSLTMFFFIRRTSWGEWLILAAATVLLYWPTIITDVAGLVLWAVVYILQKTKNKRDVQPLPA